ncbi:hypothetical protein [Paraburkholderia unamae]|nr:hypothetical protein [Paraburkholderia unamae]
MSHAVVGLPVRASGGAAIGRAAPHHARAVARIRASGVEPLV